MRPTREFLLDEACILDTSKQLSIVAMSVYARAPFAYLSDVNKRTFTYSRLLKRYALSPIDSHST